jgi:light-regulated signal transduction histidine kinase (bacteriophytochrome)
LDVQRLRHENAELRELERRRSEELAAAYKDLESFSYSISHDLRAPLRHIDGFSQILENKFSKVLGEDGLRILRIIRSGSQMMDDLIVSLLEFSRVGRAALNREPIDMTLLARAATVEARSLYTGPEPLIEISELPAVEGDATVMRQVWANLVGNALKYSAKRAQPRISISGRIENREAIYQVQDNGAGFDMQYVDRLFTAFQRLHGDRDFKGSGIGLATVSRIIRRHHGTIRAESEIGRGATFYFTLAG